MEDSGRTRPFEHVVWQDLRPELFDSFRLGEEAVAADIETKPFIPDGARQAAHVLWVGFEHGDSNALFREQISGGQPCRSSADDGNSFPEAHACHLMNSNPAL